MSDDWFDNLERLVPVQRVRPEASGDDTENPWMALFQQHPEGGGHFGGRDNALTTLVGFFRAKGFPLEAALDFASDWNTRYCMPPLDVSAVADKVQRAWIVWAGNTMPDNEPVKEESTELQILRWPDMQRKVSELGELEWLVNDVLLSGGLAFISAPAGGGKSWVAADLVRCLSSGGYWLGQLEVSICNVLYIDEEMGVTGMYHRLNGLSASPETLYYMDQQGVRLDNPKHMDQILNAIREYSIRLVIIDTFVRVHGQDENDNSRMSSLYRSFKQIKQTGCSILALHHNRKMGTESGVAHEQMRGAGDIAAQADTVFNISKRDNVYTMKATKNRHCEESKYLNISWTIATDNDKTVMLPADVQGIEVDLQTRILSAIPVYDPIKNSEATEEILEGLPNTNDIHRRVGGNRTAVIRMLKELVSYGTLSTLEGKRRAIHYYKSREKLDV
ncbi:Primase, C-terminal 1 [uncultured Caudovirales phage]|uniref:Primase, C-terminal 1 n=1 Tax=uncultured Caudovirales phage TaxID=2100421 RepID=A0A6J7XBP9_9CAUD|nr:Primase, C-terminal 1 [uncultured Caudovirales phage]CAB4182656.1 Primase, C-terminal 1 [uncultured Caudovirales phage]CAB4199743.1 Primase, C-terminal 1 [uncultured Caudovirales phage]CAB4213408.1 Primase, C-terminal 1 [uncultured Caudovirales phage]CAB4218828.1 Primase, C-terminal 1 [uncultured Caudovirales phage]